MDETSIIDLIQDDPNIMDVLRVIESLELTDWYLYAGVIRNKVWGHIHGDVTMKPDRDIDVMFFDASSDTAQENATAQLHKLRPTLDWDVKNQAFCHVAYHDEPYANSLDGLSKLPETATAIGIRLENGELTLAAPHGIDDLLGCIIRPTPIYYQYPERKQIIIERLYHKRLFEKWPKLKVII